MTFFSGTDLSTLVQEGTEQNHFLSLIVNNEGAYTAKITRKVNEDTYYNYTITKTNRKYYHTYGDECVELDSEDFPTETKEEVKKTQYIETFDLNINKSSVYTEFDELNQRISGMLTRKEPAVKIQNYNYSKYKWDLSDDYYPEKTTDKDFARSIAFKLLTGSILATPLRDKDMKEWIKNIDKTYENTFGKFTDSKTDETWNKITEWIDYMSEYLLFTFTGDGYGSFAEQDAKAVIDYINKFNSTSLIVRYIIKSLKSFIDYNYGK